MSSASAAEPNMVVIKDHAKRHQSAKPPLVIIKALKLTAEDASALYVSDTQTYGNPVEPDPSKHQQVVQVHYAHDTPSPAMQRFRGMGFLLNPRLEHVAKVVVKSYPYADPIVGEEFPAAFSEEQQPTAKFSVSRQGFVARVFKVFGTVNISTHRKIDCSRSRFGNSIPMKEMFLTAAQKRGLDVEQLFKTANDALYCHVFFVSHAQMRLLPTENDDDELIYLGSMKQQTGNWAEMEEEEVTFEDMVPCDPGTPELEALRPQYHNHEEARRLFAQGVPLVAWVKGQAPTRLVPSSYDEKERIRGNVPNLRLAFYTLLNKGEQDKLKLVLPESKHGLLDEYWAELLQMVDGQAVNDSEGYLEIRGPNMPTEGSLVHHLVERYFQAVKLVGEEQTEFIKGLGKATGPIVRTMLSYAKPMTGLSDKQKTAKLCRFLRRHLWKDLVAERLYTAITEFKRAIAPPVERAAIDAGGIQV